MTDDLTYTFTVPQSPAEAYAAINDVRAWWSGDVEGRDRRSSTPSGATACRTSTSAPCRTTELVPDRAVAWLVTDSWLSFIEDAEEWTGTTVHFDVIPTTSGGTEVRFTHHGLQPQVECYGVCRVAWGEYILGSLKELIESGAGRPDSYGERQARRGEGAGAGGVEFSDRLAGSAGEGPLAPSLGPCVRDRTDRRRVPAVRAPAWTWPGWSRPTWSGRRPVAGRRARLTPGGGRVGSLYGGALDQQLAEQAQALGERPGPAGHRAVGELEAQAFGLAGGGNGDGGGRYPASLLPADSGTAAPGARPVRRLHLSATATSSTAAGLEDAEGRTPGQPGRATTEVTTTWRPVPTRGARRRRAGAAGAPADGAAARVADAPRHRPGHGPRPGGRAGAARLRRARHARRRARRAGAGQHARRAGRVRRRARAPGRCSRAARPG